MVPQTLAWVGVFFPAAAFTRPRFLRISVFQAKQRFKNRLNWTETGAICAKSFPLSHPSHMTRKNKPERTVEAVSQQNRSVGRAIEAMVDNIADRPDAEQRSDWEEICITRLISIHDLILGDSEQATPSQNGKAHGRKNARDSKSKTNGSAQ